MSYPPVAYEGAGGEVSAVPHLHDMPREVNNTSGGGAAYLATGAVTHGQFGLYRWDMGPGRGGPGPHFHRTISESFYVLGGKIRLYDGDRWITGVPGDFLYVPEGGIHAFKNESGEPASMLILFAPGAPREEYFETLATPGWRDTMTPEEQVEFYLRHDNHLL